MRARVTGCPTLGSGAPFLPVSWVAGDAVTEAFYRASFTGGDWRLTGTEDSPMRGLDGDGETLIAHDGTLWALAEGRTPEPRGEGTLIAVAPAGDAVWLVRAEGICAGDLCRQESRSIRQHRRRTHLVASTLAPGARHCACIAAAITERASAVRATSNCSPGMGSTNARSPPPPNWRRGSPKALIGPSTSTSAGSAAPARMRR